MTNTDWLSTPVATLDETARRAAEQRQTQLTKPPGALGRLETLAIRLAAMQGTPRPTLERVHIAVFAADHGVAAEGVSAFPQAVTAEMVRNFARGGAAISVLARQLGATLEVINLGTVVDTGPLAGVLDIKLGPGTANFAQTAAMTSEQLACALNVGRETAQRAQQSGAHLFVGGEMGIGNTTSAAALACALLDAPPELLAGPGTGLDAHGVSHKAKVIRAALTLHRVPGLDDSHRAGFPPPRVNPTRWESARGGDSIEILRRLGGFEIAALAGSYVACAQLGLPVLIDGFIATAAALVATRICPGSDQWFVYAHASAEPGHACLLEALKAQPLLDLGLRLGEGSGAAVTVPLLRLACALHNEMATFAEAGVSGKSI